MYSLSTLVTCRVCLKQNGSISIFEKRQGKTFCEVIMELSSVKIYPDDGFPSSLCIECATRVENAFMLKQDIRASDMKMREIFSECKAKLLETNSHEYVSEDEVVCNEFRFEDTVEYLPEGLTDNDNNDLENICVKDENKELVKLEIQKTGKSSKIRKKYSKGDQNVSVTSELNRTCKICGKILTRSRNLIKHMRIHTGVKPFSCEICSKQFTQEANLQTHKKIHTGEKLFKCTICSLEFSQKITLQRHMNTHAEETEKKFTCDVCHKSFVEMTLLKRHRISHDNMFDGKCIECGRVFTRPRNLIRHMKRHSDPRIKFSKKPFKCDICYKGFSKEENLVSHKKVHTREKPFICEICSEQFSHKNTLQRHMNIHLPNAEHNFSCDLCEKSFHEINLLKRHKRIKHGKIKKNITNEVEDPLE